MDLVIDLATWALMLAGIFFMLVGGIGVLRMPDVFNRGHAAGMIDSLGAPLVLMALMLQAGWSLLLLKLLLIWIFLWFTVPVAGHAVARSALLGGVKPVLAGDRAHRSTAEADRLEREEGRA